MYKEILEYKLVQKIGQYGIVKVKEQQYFYDGTKFGKLYILYDVCLEHGYGDIVVSFSELRAARKWAKEN